MGRIPGCIVKLWILIISFGDAMISAFLEMYERIFVG